MPVAVPRSIITAHTLGQVTIHVTTTSSAPVPDKAKVAGHVAGESVTVESVTASDDGFVITATVAPTVGTGSWPFGFWQNLDGDPGVNVPIAAGTVQVIPNPTERSA